MIRQHRKVILFIDNCPTHPHPHHVKLTNVKLEFFPPNTTSKLQPMDQGVITNLKANYRKKILRRMINALENKQSLDKVIDPRVCIRDLTKVWQNDVTEITIKNCFIKAGFAENTTEKPVDDLRYINVRWNELQSTGAINDNISLTDYLAVDKDLMVTDYSTDDAIINYIRSIEL
ncbi:tigger transposable element-derived protein 4-like [Diorhabda carinulata]|uniref:tigger transposable element-derived protein 4-like n=1 Tax=Diorhabda carinulata TaxID=1163345 RepID=UPI0025A16BA3|nr:tigger transposable element-derived protein 4-like [Diorhabda carinulata]